MKIAAIISSHGFGHAARTAAVISAIQKRYPNIGFEIITIVPEWFFCESLPPDSYHYYPFESDIGVMQITPLLEDLPGTVDRLKSFLPFENQRVDFLANYFQQCGCSAVLCDIAPVGIAAARKANVPSVLIENFTWDWLYAGYLDQEPRLKIFLRPLAEVFASSDYHIQTEPVCERSMNADITVHPVARYPRRTRLQTREFLGLEMQQPVVLISMGGVAQDLRSLRKMTHDKEVVYLIPGGSDVERREGNLLLLPHHHRYYHPDLVQASDLVVGKLGYSTIAEAYHAEIPYLYIPRNHFRETAPLASFVEKELGGAPITEAVFFEGNWSDHIAAMLARPLQPQKRINGAEQIADFLIEKLGIRQPQSV
ncbi:MAG: hypothetical protein ROW48_12090 [Bellilinea sp.]|jgi:hypothetical protein